ncbi:hypothetical protein PT277_01600 [Acetobacteraceae bacterium ESL0709]|nr:hypothetical protein [Acetobacteraceae bacterium ESL0697]MDF7677396.1 hypothetical protein [Acetobacteraceae bacterium ESL0709]
MIYELAALILMGWAFLHMVCDHAGLVGKVLYFLVAVEAGAICFPARFHLPAPQDILPVLVVTIIYREVIVNYRHRPR